MSEWEKTVSTRHLEEAKRIMTLYGDFGVKIRALIGVHLGPRVTRYEFLVEPDTKMLKIKRIRDDISLLLSVPPMRVICPLRGCSGFAVEISNGSRENVSFAEALSSSPYRAGEDPLPALLGKDQDGKGFCMKLSKAPHVLIGGRSGSGKTTLLHNIILSLICANEPKHVNFLLISAQKREFSVYANTDYLWEPILGMDEDVLGSLKRLCAECAWRYDLMKTHSVRNLDALNLHLKAPLPRIVAVLDEFAYLPTKKIRELEDVICRLAPNGRAAGIHLILATKDLNAKTVTGLMKANLITRIALSVEQRSQSLTIMDQADAELLLPFGDLLYCDSVLEAPQRICGAYLDSELIEEMLKSLGRI